jgi:hypothetical protein
MRYELNLCQYKLGQGKHQSKVVILVCRTETKLERM